MNQRRRNERSYHPAYRAANRDETEKPFTLLIREYVRHESPEDRRGEEIEHADPDKKASINPRLFSRRHELHQHEENNQVQDKKAVGDRNEFPTRHARNDHGEERVRDKHRDEDNGEHPPKVFELRRADVITNRPNHVITGQDNEEQNETQPKRPHFVWFYVDNFGEKFFHAVAAALRAARTRRTATRLQFLFFPRGENFRLMFRYQPRAQFRLSLLRQ